MKQVCTYIFLFFLPLSLLAQTEDKYEKRSNKFIKTLEKDFKLTERQKEDLKKLHKETSKTIDDVADDFSTGNKNGNGKSNTVDKEVDTAVKDVENFVEKEILEEPKAKPKAKSKSKPQTRESLNSVPKKSKARKVNPSTNKV